MERLFINNNFPYVHVVTVSNGISWSILSLSEHIENLYKALNMSPDLLVVWLDREKRSETCEEFRDTLTSRLTSLGIDRDRICILIPDRMTENIILADELLIREHFDLIDYVYSFEGANGKSILKGIHSAAGVSYRETYHGVVMLKKVRLRRSAGCSASVRAFLDSMNVDCWWKGER